MNESIKNMIERRSIRAYKPDMVKKEDIEEIVKAGTYAATGMNRQSPVIIAVTDQETRDKLSAMNAAIMGTDTDPFYGAPVVLIVLADKEENVIFGGRLGEYKYYDMDAVIAAVLERAKEEFESEEGKELLKKWGVEGDYEGIGHCVIGYVEGDYPETKPRKEDYVYYVE